LDRTIVAFSKEELEVMSVVDLDEYYVDKIVTLEEKGWNPKNCKFKDGLDMRQTTLGSSVPRSRTLQSWITIGKRARSINWVWKGELVGQRSRFLQRNQLGAKCREYLNTLLQT